VRQIKNTAIRSFKTVQDEFFRAHITMDLNDYYERWRSLIPGLLPPTEQDVIKDKLRFAALTDLGKFVEIHINNQSLNKLIFLSIEDTQMRIDICPFYLQIRNLLISRNDLTELRALDDLIFFMRPERLHPSTGLPANPDTKAAPEPNR
jgi:hypothetical protein